MCATQVASSAAAAGNVVPTLVLVPLSSLHCGVKERGANVAVGSGGSATMTGGPTLSFFPRTWNGDVTNSTSDLAGDTGTEPETGVTDSEA